MACSSPCPAQDQASFDKELRLVHSESNRGKWKAAHKKLSALLVKHKDAAYVHAHRDELLEDIKRCVFYEKNPAPSFQQLISGKILRYDRRSGKIKLRYTPAQLADFQRIKGTELLVHPAIFSG